MSISKLQWSILATAMCGKKTSEAFQMELVCVEEQLLLEKDTYTA